jgi:hypothetical protein
LSQAIYDNAVWQQPISVEEYWMRLRWRLAQETGWPLEYIDDLELSAIRDYLGVIDAESKIAGHA